MKKAAVIKNTDDMEQNEKKINLTALEVQCVLELIQNKTLAKIGIDLGLSQNTVCFYLMNAGQKLCSIAKDKR